MTPCRVAPGGCLAAALLLVSLPAIAAEQRFDHRGALGLWLAGGVGTRVGTTLDRRIDGGLRLPVDLGGWVALPNTQNAIWASGRAAFLAGKPEWSVRGGYRGYFGLERWKTFFDAGGAFQITPRFAAAARFGAGVQYEVAPIAGLFLAAGAEVGGGNGFHFAADAVLGLELRTYLLD